MSDEDDNNYKPVLWEEGSIDQLTKERLVCVNKDHHVKKLLVVLEQCQRRVKTKDYTTETCHQEMKDVFMAVDHCVGDKAFLTLK